MVFTFITISDFWDVNISLCESELLYDARFRGQVTHAGAGRKAREGYIKHNVAVYTNTAHELIDAAIGCDLHLVIGELLHRIIRHAIQE